MLSSRTSSASGSVSFGTANASPTPAVATVSRSGSSLMNQVSANAATPIAGGDQEDDVERVGERLHVGVVHGRWQLREDRGVEAPSVGGRLPGKRLREVVRQLAREDRAEHGRAEGAADRAEQCRPRGGDAELAVVDGVLDGEHEHLHHEAEPEAEHEHVRRGGGDAGVGVHQREQVEADDHHRRADDREDLVAPGARDQLARADRRDQQAAHHRQQLQARGGRAGAVHDLQEERQVRDRAEEREADDQADQARAREDAVAEQRERQTGSAARRSAKTKPQRKRRPTTPRPTIFGEPHS